MQKAPNALTRKAGPLPVWGWALLVLVALFLYMRSTAPAKASGGTGLPYTPASSSAAQQPASGQGNAADNGNADLLAALGDNKLSYDALLNALQYGGGTGSGGANGGVPAGFGGGSGTSTAAVTAPTVDSGVNNAPVDTFAVAAADSSPISSTPPPLDTGAYYIVPSATPGDAPTYFQPPGYFQNEQGYARVSNQSDAVDRYLINHPAGSQTPAAATTAYTAPTPTVAQPAPVDTGGSFTPDVGYTTYTQRPTPGKNVAV